jgi:hypothetical protein
MVTVPERATKTVRRARSLPGQLWREVTASRRSLPAFVIIGAQRAGTTSLYKWLSELPEVEPALRKELHYFDTNYSRGERWYKSNFPVSAPGKMTGEATPYMLFHPLAPERASRDLDGTTRFIVLLREPVERAVSQYWHERDRRWESEPFERALALEVERLNGAEEMIRRGRASDSHQHHSYLARGAYAGQLRRWFGAVGRDRILVLEFERLLADPSVASGVATWLGLEPSKRPIPSMNAVSRQKALSAEVGERLRLHFEPFNEDLFELLGTELWQA